MKSFEYKVGQYDRYKWSEITPVNGLYEWVNGVINPT